MPVPDPTGDKAIDQPTSVETAGEEIWVVVDEPSPVFSTEGDYLGDAERGESFEVILIEEGWVLAAIDPQWPFWLQLGPGVDLIGSSQQEPA